GASHCDFASFAGPEPLVAPVPERGPPKPPRLIAPATGAPAVESTPDAKALVVRARPPRATPPLAEELPVAARTPTELQVALQRAEDQFLNSEGALDSPARRGLWPELGRPNTALGHTSEAALAWLHV